MNIIQQEQELFSELLQHYKNSEELPNTAINKIRRKPNTIFEQELKSFLAESNKRVIEAVREWAIKNGNHFALSRAALLTFLTTLEK